VTYSNVNRSKVGEPNTLSVNQGQGAVQLVCAVFDRGRSAVGGSLDEEGNPENQLLCSA